MPLGDVWSGVCRAGAAPVVPDELTLTDLCNMGYVRGSCSRYPQSATLDAVRFLIARHSNDLIQIQYVVECDHHPHAHGSLEYFPARSALAGEDLDPMLERQALAYVASYLRRRPAV